MIPRLKQSEVWLVTGSQNLYGAETLRQVAQNAERVAAALDASPRIPCRVVSQPVVKSADEISGVVAEANQAKACVGLVFWMHTFSPAKMRIAGLAALQKPYLHLHTQNLRTPAQEGAALERGLLPSGQRPVAGEAQRSRVFVSAADRDPVTGPRARSATRPGSLPAPPPLVASGDRAPLARRSSRPPRRSSRIGPSRSLKYMKRAAAVLAMAIAALVAVAVSAGAGEKAALGTWDIVASTPDGPMPSVMTVTKAEGKLKAEIELGGMKRTVSDEALEGDVLKLKVEYEGVVYAIQGKIAGDAMDGTWEGGGNSGGLKAKRRP